MRVLVTTVPMHGHFFPMVPLAQALRGAGHEVLVATPASFVDAVGQAGLPAAAVAPPLSFAQIMTVDRDGRPVALATTPQGRDEAAGRAWGRLAAKTLERTWALVDAWRPDLVVAEPSELAGPIVAAMRGVTWVEHGWGVTAMPETRPHSAAELAGELAELGVDSLPEPALALSVRPPGFGARRPGPPAPAGQPVPPVPPVPPAETGPAGATGPTGPPIQPIRYVAYNGPGVLPDWALAPRDVPRIFLTFGSVIPQNRYRDFVAVLGQIAARLPEIGAEVVVGVEPSFAERLGSLPPGVVGVGWQPLNLVLGSVDLLVHHGGSGSMMSALAAGVPQLALPQSADQFVNAFALAGAGVGRLLLPDAEAGGVDAVLAECRTLLAESSYAEAARALAVDVAAMPSPADVVDVLAKLVAR